MKRAIALTICLVAVVVGISFFMPWLDYIPGEKTPSWFRFGRKSVSILEPMFSGYDLAVKGGFLAFWLIPFNMIVIVVTTGYQILASAKSKNQDRKLTLLVTSVGAFCYAIFAYYYVNYDFALYKAEDTRGMQYGAIISLLGCVAIITGGLIYLIQLRSQVGRGVDNDEEYG